MNILKNRPSPSDTITRQPTEKEKNLIIKLRGLKSGRVNIKIVATEPVAVDVYEADFIEGEIPDGPMTNEELSLLTLIRFMAFGQLAIRAPWTGETISEDTYLTWKL